MKCSRLILSLGILLLTLALPAQSMPKTVQFTWLDQPIPTGLVTVSILIDGTNSQTFAMPQPVNGTFSIDTNVPFGREISLVVTDSNGLMSSSPSNIRVFGGCDWDALTNKDGVVGALEWSAFLQAFKAGDAALVELSDIIQSFGKNDCPCYTDFQCHSVAP